MMLDLTKIMVMNQKIRGLIKKNITKINNITIIPNTHGEFTVIYQNSSGHQIKYNTFSGTIIENTYEEIMAF